MSDEDGTMLFTHGSWLKAHTSQLTTMTAKELIELLGLEPLPGEGGYYRETYKAAGIVPASVLPQHGGARSYGTAIYYLVTPQSFSALHRVPQDEVFHFYLGDPVEMLQIDDSGETSTIVIGSDLKSGQRPQVVAPGNVWQGTRLLEGGKWALLGCTVSPGFEFADFEIKSRNELTELFPKHEELIRQFTHEQ
jgi:uncharacterized protein